MAGRSPRSPTCSGRCGWSRSGSPSSSRPVDSSEQWASTSQRRSTTSTPSRISGTPTRRSPPTSSPATCASAGRTFSSSPAPTSTASRSRARPRPRASTPQELVDRNAPRFEELMPKIDVDQRLLHPHHRPRARREGPGGHAAGLRQRLRLQGPLRGLVLPALRGLQDRAEIAEGNTCPIHEIPLEREQEENWFFKLSAFQERLEKLYAEQPGLRASPTSAATRRSRSSRAGCRTSRSRGRS